MVKVKRASDICFDFAEVDESVDCFNVGNKARENQHKQNTQNSGKQINESFPIEVTVLYKEI